METKDDAIVTSCKHVIIDLWFGLLQIAHLLKRSTRARDNAVDRELVSCNTVYKYEYIRFRQENRDQGREV